MRAELVHLRESTEKLRTVTWANEPVATLEDTVVEVASVRAMLESIECEALAAYDASKEYKATGDTSAAARISWLTHSRKSAVERRGRPGRPPRLVPPPRAAVRLRENRVDPRGGAHARRPLRAGRRAPGRLRPGSAVRRVLPEGVPLA